ncbi:Linear amide C-N hydrolases, choloylglycine hydrolase family [Marinomonas gallaica]|uniref:Linear amide C-N hydrolases, choloylglycine hydrolase family n=1 Tax=Marinomonas gallaica TaxID=1806667 RepID=A0A1C3JUV6_9GAMM|nr:linear amide C-N hydrolase [Marinomonas gallaica]SBT18850.1 Linear amide C-N hydrolases, choloylglycine hydrolase family [Marinomonas gallaica]SBT21805.1 Linear amide C-N hydrolases, choloylglycine hydrolase family [Marinomonas gallaica]
MPLHQHAAALGIKHENILSWSAKYASITTQVGDGATFGTDDGINEAGLVVNILYDSDCDYGPVPSNSSFQALSVLRWGQFILDNFDTVESTIEYFQQNKINLISEAVPGDENSGAELHVALCDESGNSAVIEVHDGEMVFYTNQEYTVVTNQPSYAAQLIMSQYWFYQWGLSEVTNHNPVYTAPGGDTPVQRFQRACFYRYMHRSKKVNADRLMQVRSMINTCAVPLLFQANNHGGEESPYTLWVNLADSTHRRYYFLFTDRIGSLEFEMSNIEESKRIKVAGDQATTINHGIANSAMEPCRVLFED